MGSFISEFGVFKPSQYVSTVSLEKKLGLFATCYWGNNIKPPSVVDRKASQRAFFGGSPASLVLHFLYLFLCRVCTGSAGRRVVTIGGRDGLAPPGTVGPAGVGAAGRAGGGIAAVSSGDRIAPPGTRLRSFQCCRRTGSAGRSVLAVGSGDVLTPPRTGLRGLQWWITPGARLSSFQRRHRTSGAGR